MLDTSDEMIEGVVDTVQDLVLNVVVGDFVIEKIVVKIFGIITESFSLTNVATNLTGM